MDVACFRHQSDSRYCFSIDETHVLLRLAISKQVKIDSVELIYGDPMGFAKKHRSQVTALRFTDQGYNYYETIVELEPMRLMYVFLIRGEGRSCYYSESGLTDTYQFDLGFISAFQFVGENRNDIVVDKSSWQGRVFYQIFVERFAMGLIHNDKSYVDTKWDTAPLNGKHRAFLGGDLQGIIDHLDYLEDLGVEALYLTPIHPSPSNHKYDVLDYYEVDPRFGGKPVFSKLIEEAHRRGMKVMMDLVFNHTSDEHPFFRDVCLKGKASPYYDWYFIKGEKPCKSPLNYRCFGTFYKMPKLDTNNKKVQDYLIGVASYWLKEMHADGYRLDVSEGVSHDFWTRMKIALKDIDDQVILIGENWLNSESYLGNNQFDGVMNYPFLGVVSGYVLNIVNAQQTAERLVGLWMRYKEGHSRMMLNILSSHDVQRFYHLVRCDKDLSLLGNAMMMFYPGYPLVYYGEEVFMDGAGDPDNRRGMVWDEVAFLDPMHVLFKQLIHLRKNEILKKGGLEVKEHRGLLMIKRYYKGKMLSLFCNMGNDSVKLLGKVVLSNHYQDSCLGPKGFAVIES